jgi:hypothetical protein
MKRTKPYVAEATGRGTGAMLITAVVTRVLLLPMKIPDAMVAAITAVRLSGKRPMTRLARAIRAMFP